MRDSVAQPVAPADVAGLPHARRALQLRIPHAPDRQYRLLFRIDAVEDHAHQPDVQRLFDHPLRLVGLRREAREQRDVGLEIAFLEDRAAIGHRQQEDVQCREVQRVVLHVGVDEVDRRLRRLSRIGG